MVLSWSLAFKILELLLIELVTSMITCMKYYKDYYNCTKILPHICHPFLCVRKYFERMEILSFIFTIWEITREQDFLMGSAHRTC